MNGFRPINLMRAMVVASIGATTMYFLDPRMGRRRRTVLRDRTLHFARASGHQTSQKAADLSRRIRGNVYQLFRTIRPEPVVDNAVLEARVRSRIGRALVRNRFSLHHLGIKVDQGHVALTGEVPGDRIQRLVAAVYSVRGVRKVHNELTVQRQQPTQAQQTQQPKKKAA